ncbi:MAG TPA: cupin domain-containing protein [Thermoanaerobaculia bacterium]|jgi:oxalate decarboxylase|nr:cupin domain-containing protein [Thermoanaerobaculia bacterium]
MQRISPFVFDLAGSPPQAVAKGGTVQEAKQSTFPALGGNALAVFLVTLEPGAVRIPHWHPDASELDYCLQGKARFGLSSPGGEWESFELDPGQISIIPQGWFHYFQNIGNDPLRMLVIFNNSNPNDIGISIGFQAIPKEVLGTTFSVPAERFKDLDLTVRYIAPQ